MYKKYLSHRPASMPEGPLHLGCLNRPKDLVWYKKQPLDIHQIEKVTKNATLTRAFVVRASKSRMVAAAIPRDITKKRIGHLSKIDSASLHR